MTLKIGAGDQKGRALRTPKRASTRPTSARARAALFNILGDRVLRSRWLDLYAGSGAIGLEALCRGAAWATFVEAHPDACRCITDNLHALGYDGQAEICCRPVRQFLRPGRSPTHPHDTGTPPFDVVFADPPYDARRSDLPLDQLLLLCRQSGKIAAHAWLIVEHAAGTAVPPTGGGWRHARTYTYGDSALTVYHPPEATR
jgi:16S rRNA (guanine(966)-N(2))-methyltransferase RsmD